MSLREMHEQQKQSSPREQLQELNRQSRTEPVSYTHLARGSEGEKTMAKYTKRRDKRRYEWKSAYREKEALMLERGYPEAVSYTHLISLGVRLTLSGSIGLS